VEGALQTVTQLLLEWDRKHELNEAAIKEWKRWDEVAKRPSVLRRADLDGIQNEAVADALREREITIRREGVIFLGRNTGEEPIRRCWACGWFVGSQQRSEPVCPNHIEIRSRGRAALLHDRIV
jgi:hypothetical protein